MQRLEVSGAVRPIYGSLGVKRLKPLYPGSIWNLKPNFSEGLSEMTVCLSLSLQGVITQNN